MTCAQLNFWERPTPLAAMAPADSWVDSVLRERDLRERIEADIAADDKTAKAQTLRAEIRAALAPKAQRPGFDAWLSDVMERAADDVFPLPHQVAEISDEDRRWAFSANGTYVAICRERTGRTLPDSKLAKAERQSAELLAVSKKIADKMTAAGWNAYRENGFELTRYFVHSREKQEVPNFRRSCFIPWSAQAIRAPMLAALEHWLSRNPYARMWTLSSGPRVQLPMLAERKKDFDAKLSNLNEADFMRAAGVRFVFVGEELGTPTIDEKGQQRDGGYIERDADGQLYFHLHAHVIVEFTKGPICGDSNQFDQYGERLSNWQVFLGRVQAFWPWWVADSGAIRTGKECCKYVTKPAELDKLTGAELVELQAQLNRKKMCRPLGSLAEEIAEREEKDLRLVRKQTPDGAVYYAVKNWNRHARRTSTEKAQDAARRLAARDFEARGALRVVARGIPRFGRSGVAEPCVTVMTMRGSWNEETVRNHPLVAPVIAATAAQYDSGVRARLFGINVHTRTPTPAPDPMTEARWRTEGLRKATCGAARAGF